MTDELTKSRRAVISAFSDDIADVANLIGNGDLGTAYRKASSLARDGVIDESIPQRIAPMIDEISSLHSLLYRMIEDYPQESYGALPADVRKDMEESYLSAFNEDIARRYGFTITLKEYYLSGPKKAELRFSDPLRARGDLLIELGEENDAFYSEIWEEEGDQLFGDNCYAGLDTALEAAYEWIASNLSEIQDLAGLEEQKEAADALLGAIAFQLGKDRGLTPAEAIREARSMRERGEI